MPSTAAASTPWPPPTDPCNTSVSFPVSLNKITPVGGKGYSVCLLSHPLYRLTLQSLPGWNAHTLQQQGWVEEEVAIGAGSGELMQNPDWLQIITPINALGPIVQPKYAARGIVLHNPHLLFCFFSYAGSSHVEAHLTYNRTTAFLPPFPCELPPSHCLSAQDQEP